MGSLVWCESVPRTNADRGFEQVAGKQQGEAAQSHADSDSLRHLVQKVSSRSVFITFKPGDEEQ